MLRQSDRHFRSFKADCESKERIKGWEVKDREGE